MVCSILVSQVPDNIQPALHLWLDEREGVDTKDARAFLVRVKTALVDKKISLDYDYRDLSLIALMTLDDEPAHQGSPKRVARDEVATPDAEDGRTGVNTVKQDPRRANYRRRGPFRGNSRRYTTRVSSDARCFICDSARHFMAQCPERCCPKCGRKGHDIRGCRERDSQRDVFQASACSASTMETSVMLPVKINGREINAMLDTGADPSVVDRVTAQRLGLAYHPNRSRVFGVGHIPVAVCGRACVSIDIGDNQVVEYGLDILDTEAKTVILGRGLLAHFGGTTFDWERLRVKLGDHWKDAAVGARGGDILVRANVLQQNTDVTRAQPGAFDVNPSLPPDERSALMKILDKYQGVFAENPKKPHEIATAEHAITLIDPRPVRHRPLRVSPTIELEVNRQIN